MSRFTGRIRTLERHISSEPPPLSVTWIGPSDEGLRSVRHAHTALECLAPKAYGAYASCAVWIDDQDHVSVSPLLGVPAADVPCWCGEVHELPW